MRERMTWNRKNAGQAPALPGYGSEDRDHPAYQPEPAFPKYQKGNPDAWAETPKAPPYPEGNPPALPGYDTEDQDHPAYKRQPRVDKLAAMVEKRASKALVIATNLLGGRAKQAEVERKALEIMDWSDNKLDSHYDRVSGGFLSTDTEIMDEGPMGCGGQMGDMGLDDFGGDDFGGDDFGGDDFGDDLGMSVGLDDPFQGQGHSMFASALRVLAHEIADLKKKANQNAYPGPTLGGPAKNEAALRAEAAATAKGEVHASVFDRMDRDRDGFVLASEFKGSKAIFAAIDVDADGIISKSDYLTAFSVKASDDEDDDDEGEMASKKKAYGNLEFMASLTDDEIALLRNASEDEDEEDDGEVASKQAARLASIRASKKAAARLAKLRNLLAGEDEDDGEDEGEDEGEGEMASKKAAARLANKLRNLLAGEGEDDGEDDGEDEDEGEVASKKAAARLAKLRKLFAGEGEDDGEDDGEDEGEGEVASKKAAARLANKLRKLLAGEMPEAFKENAQKMKDKAKGKDKDKDDDDKPDFLKGKSAKKAEDDGEDDASDKEAGFFATGGDPMGLGGDPTNGFNMTAEDEAILASIFSGDVSASSLPGDVVASMKPQPKQAANGRPIATGNMTRVASNGLSNLSDLWDTAPDVSKVFG